MQSTQKAWAGGGNTQRKKQKHVRFHTPRMRLHMTRNTISLGEQCTLLAGIPTAWREISTEQIFLKGRQEKSPNTFFKSTGKKKHRKDFLKEPARKITENIV